MCFSSDHRTRALRPAISIVPTYPHFVFYNTATKALAAQWVPTVTHNLQDKSAHMYTDAPQWHTKPPHSPLQ